MINMDATRFEKLIQAETKLDILYNYITKSKFISKEDILIMMGWDQQETEDDINNALGGTE